MSQKSRISDPIQYINSFDRIFIAPDVFSGSNRSETIDFLISALSSPQKQGTIVLNRQTADAFASSAELHKLNDAGLLKQKEGKILSVPTSYPTAAIKLAEKRYKLLLITNDETEGFAFKKLDYDDNRINDIQACGFDGQLNCFQYDYEPPVENVRFRIKTSCKCEELRVLFYKTFPDGSFQILFRLVDNQTLARTKDNEKFVYDIDKGKLFESDKIQFVVRYEGSQISSDKLPFFFGDDQRWDIEVTDSVLHCDLVTDTGSAGDPNRETSVSQVVPENEKHRYYGGQKVSLPPDSKIETEEPVEGAMLTTSSQSTIKVGQKLGAGGEGTVYETNVSGVVVKILNNRLGNNLTRNKRAKIEYMVANPVNNANVIWPLEAVYNTRREFVGYTMASAYGVDLKKIVDQRDPHSDFGILNLTKTQIVQMIISLLETMTYLHKRNIIIGDIKLENFMIRNRDVTKVYFVDCDSYQIDKFPATKVSKGYMPPELRSINVDTQYRTFGNENYALFALLFMLLMKGGVPYAQQNLDASEEEKAAQGLFPYFLDREKTAAHGRKGFPIVNWAHLPGYIKKAFISVGHVKGSHFGEAKRMSSEEWLQLFRCYEKDLKSGRLKADPDYDVGMHDPRKADAVLDYSIVDIEAVMEITAIQKEFTLMAAIEKSLKKAGLTYDSDQIRGIYSQLAYAARYKDSKIKFVMKKNLGVLYELQCVYTG